MYDRRACKMCGREFQPKKPNGETCSGRCRTRFHRKNLLAGLKPEPEFDVAAIADAYIASLPEAPKRKRGRPKKVTLPTPPAKKRKGR